MSIARYGPPLFGHGSVMRSRLYKAGGGNLQPGPLLATAYSYIDYATFNAFYMNQAQGPIVNRHAAQLKQQFDQNLNAPRPRDRLLALQTARSLFLNNSNCCQ